ncbi:hypothetical protein SERLADRAFT_449865 [Serpula lacrymans var. lacrymans S7.9]|uniref:SET domain-containing protein n=1 Tax=Serpula lacrymans var. lacrymans (strain S7.9) TaxID=578457 RepID=F8P0A8_SERL9|nr:uncharacterized protein SERLADRAFT_449865 [Serpula lacrymans var. lacrymans S7.9]EGO23481.1 hypothetical protein SERLADRAFT_449865 [Serpula lacrymans var. lacrymans S7.9]
MELLPLPTSIRLEPHPIARDQTVAACHISSGSIVISLPPLTTVLLPSEKGCRCDYCFRRDSPDVHLRRCTGCASYWYCGAQCQDMHWAVHKNLCKAFNRYCASPDFVKLAEHEKLDALLLTHLAAQITSNSSPRSTPASSLSTFLNLRPGPFSKGSRPVVCSMTVKRSGLSSDELEAVYSRFGNNNFAIHSHLTTYAHGVFPLASRLFNHSCLPNAAAKFVLSPSEPIHMEIVAIRDISPGEEICITYLDPALLQSRQQIFELTYGFTCLCPSCALLNRIGLIPPLPESDSELASLERALRTFVFPFHESGVSDLRLPTGLLQNIPSELFPALCESYLTRLSEAFSKASHDGPFDIALDVGLTLLALYCLIYPPNYPQIADDDQRKAAVTENDLSEQVRTYLRLSRDVLDIFGQEGDPGGPLEEIRVLYSLLDGM